MGSHTPARPKTARPRAGPSIEDVARLAGVSAQTVSRVSTGSDKVRPATRERVLTAMQQLGYSPNHAARALRYGTFGTIGIIAHRLDRTGEYRTIEAVVDAARAESYTVALVDVDSPSSTGVAAAARRLSHQSIDGLIIIRAETVTPSTLALPAQLPIAVSDSRFVGSQPSVGADQVQGTQLAVDHLLSLGHNTVHHLAGPADSDPAEIRVATWFRRLHSAGRPVPTLYRGDWSAHSGYEQGLLIAKQDEVTAVFSANDEMAAGLIRALAEHGKRVPQDVSVVGFDGLALAEFLWPPLTTVRQDFHEIGRELVKLLMQQIRTKTRGPSIPVLVPTELVIRASTAPPRSGA